MRTFWKILATVLFVTAFTSFLIALSMFWWPDMPSSPRPSEGRVYPLNNHGHYTYMNGREYLLSWVLDDVSFVGMAGFATICFFVDPFNFKRRLRPLRPPPPWS
jgi:hypothetical protein